MPCHLSADSTRKSSNFRVRSAPLGWTYVFCEFSSFSWNTYHLWNHIRHGSRACSNSSRACLNWLGSKTRLVRCQTFESDRLFLTRHVFVSFHCFCGEIKPIYGTILDIGVKPARIQVETRSRRLESAELEPDRLEEMSI